MTFSCCCCCCCCYYYYYCCCCYEDNNDDDYDCDYYDCIIIVVVIIHYFVDDDDCCCCLGLFAYGSGCLGVIEDLSTGKQKHLEGKVWHVMVIATPTPDSLCRSCGRGQLPWHAA